jgi:3-oxoacyl-(acyl-carrier-protein) synthase
MNISADRILVNSTRPFESKLRHVILNSFAFGGTNAVLIASAIHSNEAGVPGQS